MWISVNWCGVGNLILILVQEVESACPSKLCVCTNKGNQEWKKQKLVHKGWPGIANCKARCPTRPCFAVSHLPRMRVWKNRFASATQLLYPFLLSIPPKQCRTFLRPRQEQQSKNIQKLCFFLRRLFLFRLRVVNPRFAPSFASEIFLYRNTVWRCEGSSGHWMWHRDTDTRMQKIHGCSTLTATVTLHDFRRMARRRMLLRRFRSATSKRLRASARSFAFLQKWNVWRSVMDDVCVCVCALLLSLSYCISFHDITSFLMHHYFLCIIFILHHMALHIFPFIVTYYYVSL